MFWIIHESSGRWIGFKSEVFEVQSRKRSRSKEGIVMTMPTDSILWVAARRETVSLSED
jgi:hypothetical protein